MTDAELLAEWHGARGPKVLPLTPFQEEQILRNLRAGAEPREKVYCPTCNIITRGPHQARP